MVYKNFEKKRLEKKIFDSIEFYFIFFFTFWHLKNNKYDRTKKKTHTQKEFDVSPDLAVNKHSSHMGVIELCRVAITVSGRSKKVESKNNPFNVHWKSLAIRIYFDFAML